MTTIIESEIAALRRIAHRRPPSRAVAALRCRVKRLLRRRGTSVRVDASTQELIALATGRRGGAAQRRA